MWEEFTQSIHTFIEDKKNLAHHTQGKKKATLIVIPSVRFTKLIVYYLQSKHKFHPRPGSPLHLPNKEPALGYLKFSAKGTKREQSKPLAPKAAPVTKPAAAKALKPTASQPPKLTPTTIDPSKKDQNKRRKLVKESSKAPFPAKQPKAGKVIKKRTPKSSLQLIDEFVDEGV
ncbi:hypothetical protein Tco_0102536, partial [Tanacetum coccineum]